MKRNLIFAIMAAALTLSGCQKDSGTSVAAGDDAVIMTVSVNDGGVTRATGDFAKNEALVNSLQVFCFDKKTGTLEDYQTSATTSVKLGITAGTKRIYALVNCPSLKSVATSEDALLSAASNFSDNGLSNFEMMSPSGDEAEFEIEKSGSLELTVRRIVAKVLVDKISADFASPGLRTADFIIQKIYLVNCAKSNRFDLSSTPTEYYSGAEDNGSKINDMIQETGLSYNLKNSASTSDLHGFYCYPNGSANKTKVVIEATLAGNAQIYSFELPDIERNKVYEVTNITITRQSGELTETEFSIKVSNWDETYKKEYKFE